MKLSDFNDLHHASGLDAVGESFFAAQFIDVDEPSDIPPSPPPEAYTDESDSPRPTEQVVARFSLDELLQRFSLAMPDGKIWDARDSKLIRKGAANDWWGEKLFKQWRDHERRATVTDTEMNTVLGDHVRLAIELCREHGTEPVLLGYPFPMPQHEAVMQRIAAAERVPFVSTIAPFSAKLAGSLSLRPSRVSQSALFM